jgi:hypothetical protein
MRYDNWFGRALVTGLAWILMVRVVLYIMKGM